MKNFITIVSALILASCNTTSTKSTTSDSLVAPKTITSTSYYEVPAIFETPSGASDTLVALVLATSESDALKKSGNYFFFISTSCDVGPAKKSYITVVLPKVR
jgi:hypothetical protein